MPYAELTRLQISYKHLSLIFWGNDCVFYLKNYWVIYCGLPFFRGEQKCHFVKPNAFFIWGLFFLFVSSCIVSGLFGVSHFTTRTRYRPQLAGSEEVPSDVTGAGGTVRGRGD